MFQKLRAVLMLPDLRKKILFVLFILVIFRLVAAIPVPGFDREALATFLSTNQFFGLLNVFSGGVLENLSIAMLGVGPYITASIVMQLMTMIFPRMKEMYQEEGEAGRRRFNQYARLLTVPFALLQAYGLLIVLIRQGILPEPNLAGFAISMITVTAGTVFLMWLGELISEQNIGNGISLLIFAGIVSRLPVDFQNMLVEIGVLPSFNIDTARIPYYLAFLAISILVIAGVIIITEGQRKIPVSYAKRVRGNRVFGGVETHLPLRVNQAGVIPIIFAISIILFPGLIGSFLATVPNPTVQDIGAFLVSIINNQWLYASGYFLLVFLFTYFYTAVTFDPESIATNIQKQGGFILGIRPGRPTAEYLARILSRITLFGALFLGIIAILPILVQAGFQTAAVTIGGTSLLIVVSVVLETLKQIDAQLVMHEYE
ncbi:preprotein translocase subunit SecY [Candidatus Parcubacteria bacterium]|nr:MAG: preprotein translocase subunit SecY [Candidatus Parcubacteria bacterium]